MRPVAALILAAGDSSRLGQPKQLLRWRGKTLVRNAVDAAIEAGCTPTAVVVGSLQSEIATELISTEAIVIANPNWQRGLGTSIRAGLEHLEDGYPELDSVVLLVCDQPLVHDGVVGRLISERQRSGKPIIAAAYANTLGVPALFDRSCFAALRGLPDDSGAKRVITARSGDVAKVDFEGGSIDIDTPADLPHLEA